MRSVIIDGVRYFWRDILRMRREQQKRERQPQPTLFELHDDIRPALERTARERFLNPSLFGDDNEQI